MSGDADWGELASAVSVRRKRLGLTQHDVMTRGGPSHETTRQVELGNRDNYRGATFVQLDRALRWATGTAEAIRDGHMSAHDAIEMPTATAPIEPWLPGVSCEAMEATHGIPPSLYEALLALQWMTGEDVDRARRALTDVIERQRSGGAS